MSNLLKDGLAWLTTQLAANASESVTYTRGANTITVRAMFGRKLLRIDDGEGGVRVEWTDMDFLIPAVDLVILGAPITPLRGDTIRVTVPNGTEVFSVSPVGSEPAWRWSDPHRSIVRAHAKHVATE